MNTCPECGATLKDSSTQQEETKKLHTFKLLREAALEGGVFGIFETGGLIPQFKTVEREWKDNTPFESCIPEGTYSLVPCHYKKGNYTAIELRPVDNRTAIYIHIANFPIELLGCIGVGDGIGTINGRLGIHNSAVTFQKLMDLCTSIWDKGDEIQLEISSISLTYNIQN